MNSQLLDSPVSGEACKAGQRSKIRGLACCSLGVASVLAYMRHQQFAPLLITSSSADPTALWLRSDVSTEPAEGVPYVIVNKVNSQGMLNAELSWDGQTYGNHAMASVEFNDPVDWTFTRRGSGYAIKSQADTQGMLNAELSWDGLRYGDHAMASVEFHDPVDWTLTKRGSGFAIKSQADTQGMLNAELSWDGQTVGSHAMASVEFHDPVDWAIVPSFTVSAEWIPKQHITATPDNPTSVTLSWGIEHQTSWSQASTFANSVAASASASPSSGGGVKGPWSLPSAASQSVAATIGGYCTATSGEDITQHFSNGHLWQWRVTVHSNHYAYRNAPQIQTLTRDYILTESSDQRPQCAPGFCFPNSHCQQCHPGGELSA